MRKKTKKSDEEKGISGWKADRPNKGSPLARTNTAKYREGSDGNPLCSKCLESRKGKRFGRFKEDGQKIPVGRNKEG